VVVVPRFLATPPRGHYGAYYSYEQDLFFEVFVWDFTLLRTRTDQLRQTQFNKSNNKFIYKKQKASVATCRSGAHVFWLAFKPLDYKLRGVFNAATGSLRRLSDGPLHHWLKGDLEVLAPPSQRGR
jgi:hypothetical protein